MKSWPSNVAQWENNCLSPNPSNPPASLSLPLPVSLSLSLSTPRPYFFPLSEGKEWEELEKKQGPEKAAIWENTLGAEKPACCRRPRNTMSCIMRCSGAVLGRALTVALGSEALVSPRLNEAPWGDAESENQRETSNLFHSPGRDNQRCGSVNLPSRNATKKEGAPRDSKIASCHNTVMWSVMIIEGVGFHTVILELAEHFRARLHGKHLFGTKSAVEGTYSRSSMRCLTILEQRRWQIGPLMSREGYLSPFYLSWHKKRQHGSHLRTALSSATSEASVCASRCYLAIKCWKLIRLVIVLATPKPSVLFSTWKKVCVHARLKAGI